MGTCEGGHAQLPLQTCSVERRHLHRPPPCCTSHCRLSCRCRDSARPVPCWSYVSGLEEPTVEIWQPLPLHNYYGVVFGWVMCQCVGSSGS